MGSLLKRPATMDAYMELVNQALFEVEELRMSVEFDMEFMEDALGFVDSLEKQLRELHQSLESGNYKFVDNDLPFMQLLNTQNDMLLPFKGLLRRINDVHRKGLEAE